MEPAIVQVFPTRKTRKTWRYLVLWDQFFGLSESPSLNSTAWDSGCCSVLPFRSRGVLSFCFGGMVNYSTDPENGFYSLLQVYPNNSPQKPRIAFEEDFFF